ncbi:TolC family protein [Kamptonema cortianum]|nr:TolC family protein [Geitlerinema splendidum]MDK3155721.1 TolC family protein [Kamptonema cortianum]MDL5047080.1 TolC family protein [Oscillatoria amoena NRMC-F 0135]
MMKKLNRSVWRLNIPGLHFAIAFATTLIGSLILSAISPNAQTESSIAASPPQLTPQPPASAIVDKIQAELQQALQEIYSQPPQPQTLTPIQEIYRNKLLENLFTWPSPPPLATSQTRRTAKRSDAGDTSATVQDWTPILNAATQLQYSQVPQPENLPGAFSVPDTSTLQLEGTILTLNDVVLLAVENNREIKNAYLERVVQRQDLAVAEDKFNPNFIPRLALNVSRNENGQFFTSLGGVDVGTTISTRMPTGATIELGWLMNQQLRDSNRGDVSNQGELKSDFRIGVRQPLLRGSGISVNRASIESARLTEQINLLNLQSTLSNKITETILAYRRLMQAQEELKNAQVTLSTTRRLQEITQALIDAGRTARVDLVQSQADVANQELNFLQAQNAVEQARISLLDLLDLDENLPIVATEPILTQTPVLNAEELQQFVYERNPEYRIADLTVNRTQYDLIQANDERRWNLDLDVNYGNNASSLVNENRDLQAGLVFSREFGDLTIEQRYKRSQINALQAENNLQNLRESLNLQVNDRVRNVNLRRTQVEQARQARELAEQNLSNEQIKLGLGRDTSIRDVVAAQNALSQARSREVQTIIEYLNAITDLDRILGTTLETWQITLQTD